MSLLVSAPGAFSLTFACGRDPSSEIPPLGDLLAFRGTAGQGQYLGALSNNKSPPVSVYMFYFRMKTIIEKYWNIFEILQFSLEF